MKQHILLLALSLTGLFATQVQANQLSITTNLSTVRITGSVDDYLTGDHDGYTEGFVFSSTAIPLQIDKVFYDNDVSITNATTGSQAELSLDIAQTLNGYRIWGNASSTATTEMNSLIDNDATANGEAIVDLAFTLTSDYSFSFATNIFNVKGIGESEVELINTSTGTVFSQIVSEDALDLGFSGNLQAGDYTLFIGVISEAIDGDFASASIGYDLQLTEVPLPGVLPLFLSGFIALSFKKHSERKAFL